LNKKITQSQEIEETPLAQITRPYIIAILLDEEKNINQNQQYNNKSISLTKCFLREKTQRPQNP